MSDPKTLPDSTSATSSQASPAGPLPCGSRDTLTHLDSGPVAAPASPSLPPVNAKEPLMPDTSGPKCAASLNSAALQSSLENRLRARMEGRGAPEYVLTWKHWDMPSGPPICALRASGRRISDKDCTGVAVEGWKSPKATEGMGRYSQCNGVRYPGLWMQAAMVGVEGWSTPRANKWGFPDSHGSNETPTGWATPTTRDHKDTGSLENVPVNCLLGRQAPLSTVPTERRAGYALNPNFSMWLMGFPMSWSICGQVALRKKKST